MVPNPVGIELACELDAQDPLSAFRQEFLLPETEGRPDIYFVGNSLGLQPKRTAARISQVLQQWHSLGVRGHFEGDLAWIDLPEVVSESMAALVGASTAEVVVMNTLTVNLHLMLASFYQPTSAKHVILIEEHAFPSDHQAVTSHLQMRGYSADKSLKIVRPKPGDALISTEQICEMLRTQRDTLALALLPGVQYYTGQVFDMRAIAAVARECEVVIGFDLAHAAGNIPLELNDWNVDFACWCTYKYLNSGPGALGGCFIHQRHVQDRQLPRLAGWWGHERATRFQMQPEFVPPATAQGWQLSNPPILALAPIQSSLQLFREAGGIVPLHQRSMRLNQFFRAALQQELEDRVHVLTPEAPGSSGCQLSLEIRHAGKSGKETFGRLEESLVRTDWREPNVIRAAPVPLYNTFEEIWRFVETLAHCVD